MFTVGDVLNFKNERIKAMEQTAQPAQRPIYEIAADIKREWSKLGKGVSPYAKPYLDAMFSLTTIQDNYILDSGSSVVLYFLSNATSFRGERAKQLKAELKAMFPKSYFK